MYTIYSIYLDISQTYLPAFEACVREGNAGGIMCSYNAVNGVPSCANSYLLNTIAREQWGFEGYIVSILLRIHTYIVCLPTYRSVI